jgi:excinuclease ABC subunit C
VPGIGPKKKKALIRKFGSPRGVKLASLQDLQQVEGISGKLAQVIFEHFATERAELLAREAAKAARTASDE